MHRDKSWIVFEVKGGVIRCLRAPVSLGEKCFLNGVFDDVEAFHWRVELDLVVSSSQRLLLPRRRIVLINVQRQDSHVGQFVLKRITCPKS